MGEVTLKIVSQVATTGLPGPAGQTGKSAYEVYVETTEDSLVKSEKEWIDSLKGADGAPGAQGTPGHNPCLGVFADESALPSSDVQAGDYAYATVTDSSVTPATAASHVFRYDGTRWQDNGEGSPDAVTKFDGGSGPAVASVKIVAADGESDVTLPTVGLVRETIDELVGMEKLELSDGAIYVDKRTNGELETLDVVDGQKNYRKCLKREVHEGEVYTIDGNSSGVAVDLMHYPVWFIAARIIDNNKYKVVSLLSDLRAMKVHSVVRVPAMPEGADKMYLVVNMSKNMLNNSGAKGVYKGVSTEDMMEEKLPSLRKVIKGSDLNFSYGAFALPNESAGRSENYNDATNKIVCDYVKVCKGDKIQIEDSVNYTFQVIVYDDFKTYKTRSDSSIVNGTTEYTMGHDGYARIVMAVRAEPSSTSLKDPITNEDVAGMKETLEIVPAQQLKTVGGETLLGDGSISFKTINDESILGEGNITIESASGEPVDETSILYLNPDEEFVPKLSNMKRLPRKGSATQPVTPNSTQKLTPLVLAHFSDIHGSQANLERIVEFCSHHSETIDDVVCSGDMVANKYDNGMGFWNGVAGAENILMCIGNHDTNLDSSSAGKNYYNMQQCYEQYISPYVENWNVIYEPNKTYYYKDYPSAKVRLIVVDCIKMKSGDTAQEDWLKATLVGAQQNNLSVVIMTHYNAATENTKHSIRTNINGGFDCSFNAIQNKTIAPETAVEDYINLVDTVEQFMNGTLEGMTGNGEFVCYLSGHKHLDSMGVAAKKVGNEYISTNQVNISIDCASANPNPTAYSDTWRSNNVEGEQPTRAYDLFNLVGIDTYQKLIKIVRVGANVDSWMRKKDMITIQYADSAARALSNGIPEVIKIQ